MFNVSRYEPVDYLIIGHIARDLTPEGVTLGGTVSYASRTALAFGLRVGVVTAWGQDVSLDVLDGVSLKTIEVEHSTTFENTYTGNRRIQKVHHVADELDYQMIPQAWREAPIVHIAPLAQELSPTLVRHFPEAILGLTPQGWLRDWDSEGNVSVSEWPEARFVLPQVKAAVISIDDIGGDQHRLDEMTSSCPLLVVTLGRQGADLYYQGNVEHISTDQVDELDPTGAGDIFAASFFYRIYAGDIPSRAVRFANRIAGNSVTRIGLNSTPTEDEFFDTLKEVN